MSGRVREFVRERERESRTPPFAVQPIFRLQTSILCYCKARQGQGSLSIRLSVCPSVRRSVSPSGCLSLTRGPHVSTSSACSLLSRTRKSETTPEQQHDACPPSPPTAPGTWRTQPQSGGISKKTPTEAQLKSIPCPPAVTEIMTTAVHDAALNRSSISALCRAGVAPSIRNT